MSDDIAAPKCAPSSYLQDVAVLAVSQSDQRSAAPSNGAVFERTGARIRRSLAFWRDGDGEGAGEGVLRRSEGGQLAGDAVRYEEGAHTTGVSSGRGRDQQGVSGLRTRVQNVEGPATPAHCAAAGRGVRTGVSPPRAGDGASKCQSSALLGGPQQGSIPSQPKGRHPASSVLGPSLPPQP